MKKLLIVVLIILLAITNAKSVEYVYPLIQKMLVNPQFSSEQSILRIGAQQAYCNSMLLTSEYIVDYTNKYNSSMSSKGLRLAANMLEFHAVINSKFHNGTTEYEGITLYCIAFIKEFKRYFLKLKYINTVPKLDF